jgi:phage recombination protein Bet
MQSEIMRAETAQQQVARFTPRQLDLIKTVIAKDASDDELALFIAQCQRTQLDPFARQIYCIGRWDNRLGRKVFTTQVSIDGMRLIAQRSGEYAGQTPMQWCCQDGVWTDVWLKRVAPTAARVGILRRGFSEPLYAVALWSEYCPLGKDGKPNGLWPMKPALMIGKCAESLGLRRAFPAELSDLYTPEEMEHDADEVAQPTAADRRVDNSALFAPKAAPAALPAPADARVSVEWPSASSDVVTIRKIVPRGKAMAACCETADGTQNWVSVALDMAGPLEVGRRVVLAWEQDADGRFFKAVSIDRAPEPKPQPDSEPFPTEECDF